MRSITTDRLAGHITLGRAVARVSAADIFQRITAARAGHPAKYYAMYSSWAGGIVTDPALMIVPADDHIVHRGDGVFEALKCVSGNLYGLDEHLQRLERSAKQLSLEIPLNREQLTHVIEETVRAGGTPTCLVRVFVSRGPGGFSVSPGECIGAQTYVVTTELTPPSPSSYTDGVAAVLSRVPARSSLFANIKSCSYLASVMMKMDAMERGAEFSLALDERGSLAEGATENVAIVTADGEFITPPFAQALCGITIMRVLDLARNIVQPQAVAANSGSLRAVTIGRITVDQARSAREMMLLGTTLDVLPVTRFDDRPVASGRPGPVAQQLQKALAAEIEAGTGPYARRMNFHSVSG